jgi:transcriptional regulator NrdR family protein
LRCPECYRLGLASGDSKVLATRERVETGLIVRRRECSFGHRHSTIEVELEEWGRVLEQNSALEKTLYKLMKERIHDD